MENEYIHGKWELCVKKNPFKNRTTFELNNTNGTNDKIIKAPKSFFFADPYILLHDNFYYIFFEHYDYNRGKIAYVKLDKNLNTIIEPTILNLCIETHLSYPYIFSENNEYYMIIESCHSSSVPIYKCKNFPDEWELVKKNILDEPNHCADNSIIKHNNLYYLFTHNYKESIAGHKRYHFEIYYSKSLLGKYNKHKIVNSIIDKNNEHNTRGAGKIFKINNELIRPAQFSDRGINGEGVIFYKIKKLSSTEFNEEPINIFSPDLLNYRAMHTISYNELNDIMVIDGRLERNGDNKFKEINISNYKKMISENNFYVDHDLLKEVFSYNTSGGGINYYSIEIDGIKYKGERDWYARWNLLKDIEYENKRILDIGCNTAITLTYLKKFKNVKYCLGVDMPDELLLKTNKANTIIAAKKLDEAFQVSNDYLQIDLNNSNYENKIGSNFDIAIVMSILKWIDDKKRFLNYLKNFNNIIYEAHEPDNEIISLFKEIGFNEYKILGKTQIGISYHSNDMRTLFLFTK